MHINIERKLTFSSQHVAMEVFAQPARLQVYIFVFLLYTSGFILFLFLILIYLLQVTIHIILHVT